MKIPTIRFVFARKGLSPKNGKGLVEMVITYQRQRKFISTGVMCHKANWKDSPKDMQFVRGSGEDMELNGILVEMYKKALRVVTGMVESDAIDIGAIPSALKQRSVDLSFIDYVRRRMSEKKVVDYTLKSYESFLRKLVEYGKIVRFSDITEKAIRDFDEWLQGYSWVEQDAYGREVRRKYSQATIGSFHKNMKSFISDAVVDGYLKENAYVAKRIRIDKGKSRIDNFLTVEEIGRIERAKMPTRSLEEARDLFLMQVYTGLAYIDLMTYDFKGVCAEGGEMVCVGKRHKTGVEFAFVLLPEAIAILERYDYFLPKLPNQKYNVKLKLVADSAGIDKPITSHDGRRSCGYVLLNAGVPIEVVSRVLGHGSVRMTEAAYARVLNKTIVEAFAKIKKDVPK